MSGPKLQFSASDIFDFQYDEEGKIVGATLRQETSAFLSALQDIAIGGTRSGNNSSRPTSTMTRWVGMPYFDTTLGLPVFLKTASSNAWVKADGTAA